MGQRPQRLELGTTIGVAEQRRRRCDGGRISRHYANTRSRESVHAEEVSPQNITPKRRYHAYFSGNRGLILEDARASLSEGLQNLSAYSF